MRAIANSIENQMNTALDAAPLCLSVPATALINETKSYSPRLSPLFFNAPAPGVLSLQKSIEVTTGYFITIKMRRIEKGNTLNESRVKIVSANIGRGADAFVHMATYNQLQIALKEYKFKPREFTDDRLSKFENELNILKLLKHDNIIQFLGYRLNIKRAVLKFAFAFCRDGNLFNFIHPIDKKVEYEYKDALRIALDVAKAMQYVHSKHIIHRDLNPRNVLLFEQCTKAKLTDFGESVLVNDTDHKEFDEVMVTDAQSVGTAGYKAPEMIKIDTEHGYNCKVDVFGFGSLCYELYTRQYVSGLRNLKTYDALKGHEHFLLIPDDTPEMFGQLIYECWQFDPAKRPSFAQIVNSLNAMIDECD